jgi:hypothetical protein
MSHEEFNKIATDFIRDMNSSFPEFSMIIQKWWRNGENVEYLYNYCIDFYPDKFVDILYKSDDLFQMGSQTEFLPGVSFSHIWNYDDMSEKNREMIWNYLQMIMISIIGDIREKKTMSSIEESSESSETSFEETTSNLLKTFESEDFNNKLQETISSLQENLSKVVTNNDGSDNNSREDPFECLMDTKLASLAKEIALETTEDFKEGLENVKDVNDVFQHIFKDPARLMNIVKNVGEKLDVKMKNGDLDEKDILNEATSLMSKMKNIPGMENMQDMMRNIQRPQGANSTNSKKTANSTNSTKAPKFAKKKQAPDEEYLNKLYDQMMKQQQQTNQLQRTL